MTRIHIKLFVIFFFLYFARCLFAQTSTYASKLNINYRTIDVVSDTDTYKNQMCKLDVFYQINTKDNPTIIFLHGGGLTSGEKYFPDAFKFKNINIVAPNYRLSPTVLNPGYFEDAASAVAWTFNHINEFGGSRNKIYLSGYSAGAYLATMIFLNKDYLGKYNIDTDSLKGFFSFSGQMTKHFQILTEQGLNYGSDNKIVDEWAPLYYVRKTICPAVFYTADRNLDMAGRYDQNVEMVNKLKTSGNINITYIELNGLDHVTFLEPATVNAVSFLQLMESTMSVVTRNDNNNKIDNSVSISIKNGVVYINSENVIDDISIYNTAGVQIMRKEKINNTDYLVDYLKKGLYVFKIITKNRSFSKIVMV